jgi:hypothetical protein
VVFVKSVQSTRFKIKHEKVVSNVKLAQQVGLPIQQVPNASRVRQERSVVKLVESVRIVMWGSTAVELILR